MTIVKKTAWIHCLLVTSMMFGEPALENLENSEEINKLIKTEVSTIAVPAPVVEVKDTSINHINMNDANILTIPTDTDDEFTDIFSDIEIVLDDILSNEICPLMDHDVICADYKIQDYIDSLEFDPFTPEVQAEFAQDEQVVITVCDIIIPEIPAAPEVIKMSCCDTMATLPIEILDVAIATVENNNITVVETNIVPVVDDQNLSDNEPLTKKEKKKKSKKTNFFKKHDKK